MYLNFNLSVVFFCFMNLKSFWVPNKFQCGEKERKIKNETRWNSVKVHTYVYIIRYVRYVCCAHYYFLHFQSNNLDFFDWKRCDRCVCVCVLFQRPHSLVCRHYTYSVFIYSACSIYLLFYLIFFFFFLLSTSNGQSLMANVRCCFFSFCK